MNGRAVNGKPLPEWHALDASQRAAYEAMAHGLALAPPTEKPADKAPPGVALLAFFAVSTVTACGGSAARQFEAVAHSARDVATVAEVCAFNAKEAAMAACADSDSMCKAKVLAQYAPIADVLDEFHRAWCLAAPDAEGCK
jgi:hypothetical protein